MLKPADFLKQFNRMVFSLLLVGKKQTDPGWHRRAKKHKFFSLWFINSGQGTMRFNDQVYPVEAGSLLAIVPNAITEIRSDDLDPLTYTFVRFHCCYARYDEKETHEQCWKTEAVDPQSFLLQGLYRLQNPPEIANAFEQLHHLWQRRGQMTIARRRLIFEDLMLSIVQDLITQKVTGNTTLAIERTIDFMVSNYKKKLSLEDLAHIAGLSTSHYSRLFKKYAGHSPIDYLTHLRMDRAKEMLALSDYRLKGVAQSVGYQDEFYFSRIFKKVVGLSPSAFAKRHQMKKIE